MMSQFFVNVGVSAIIHIALERVWLTFNPYLTNGLSHHYHLGQSIFILGRQE